MHSKEKPKLTKIKESVHYGKLVSYKISEHAAVPSKSIANKSVDGISLIRALSNQIERKEEEPYYIPKFQVVYLSA